jgi:hypothetical protein
MRSVRWVRRPTATAATNQRPADEAPDGPETGRHKEQGEGQILPPLGPAAPERDRDQEPCSPSHQQSEKETSELASCLDATNASVLNAPNEEVAPDQASEAQQAGRPQGRFSKASIVERNK